MPSLRSRKRARDSDRTATCDRLDVAFAEGQIDGVEHRTRVAAALRAAHIGDLTALTADLQLPGVARVRRGPSPARSVAASPTRPDRDAPGYWPVRIGVAVALVAAMAVAHAVVSRPVHRPPVPPPTAAAPVPITAPVVVEPVDLRTDRGLTELVAAVRRVSGGTVVDSLSVRGPDDGGVRIAEPGNPRADRTYTWTPGAGLTRLDVVSAIARDPDQRTVDLGDLDTTALAGLLADAPRATGVPGARSVRLMVFDPGSGPAVEITCTDGSAQRGTVTARPDGSGVAVFAAS